MANGRVQSPELRNTVELRPAPIKSDTFVQQAQQSPDRRWATLQQSLASFSTSLGNFGTTMAPSEDEQKQALWLEQRRINGMTKEEQNALSDAGQLPVYDKPFVQRAVNAIFGGTRGQTFADELKAKMTTDFDWNTGNADAYITNQINAYLEGSPYKDDPNFGANFQRNANVVREWANDFGNSRKVQQTVDSQEQAAFDYIDSLTRHQLKGGTDPEAVANTLFSQYSNLGKDGTLGVDNDRLDNIVLNVARRIVDDYPEGAVALVNHRRMGRDGLERSFAMDKDKQDVVLQIVDAATRAQGKKSEAKQRQQIADTDVETFRAGKADSIADVTFQTSDGRSVTVTKETRLKAAEAEYLRASNVIAKARQETISERLARDLAVARSNGRKLPYLEEQLTNISDMASIDMIGNPDAKAKLMTKLATYRWQRQESPGSLTAYTSEKDRDFAEAFLDAVDFLGRSDDQALDFAIKVAQPVDASGRENLAKYQQEIDSEINSLASRKSWFGIEMDSAPTNFSTIRAKVSQLAGKMVIAGLPPKDAIEMAAKSIKERSIVHNGSVLFLQGLDVPENFGDVVDEALADFMQKNPKVIERSGYDPEDLTIVPLGGNLSGGRFVIANRENVIDTLRDDAGNVAVITLAGLRGTAAKMAEDARQVARLGLRQSVFDNSARQKGLIYARDTDGSLNWINPHNREVYSVQYTDKDDAPIWSKTGKRYSRTKIVTEDGGFVIRGFEAGKDWGRLRGSDLKAYRERMRKVVKNYDETRAERRKFWAKVLPSVKVGETVINE